MNYKMIKFTLGWILLFESGFFLLPVLVGVVYGEAATLAFLWTLLCSGGVGTLLILKKPQNTKL